MYTKETQQDSTTHNDRGPDGDRQRQTHTGDRWKGTEIDKHATWIERQTDIA